MNKPGLSVDTGPAVRAVLVRAECLYTDNGNLHHSPVAENVAAVVIAAFELADAAMRVVESVGLDPEEVADLLMSLPEDAPNIPEIVKLIRSKYA